MRSASASRSSARWHHELVAPRHQLGERRLRLAGALLGAQALVLGSHAVELVQIPLELLASAFEVGDLGLERLARVVRLLVAAARPSRLVDQLVQACSMDLINAAP